MARWTKWRKIADKDYWYEDEFDHDGPACYELAIGGPRGGNKEIKYVGETENEWKRVSIYARTGSHLRKKIEKHMKKGKCLYYRRQAKRTKKQAKAMQDRQLMKYDYPWNVQLNVDDY